jgi:hypothetical protein
VFQLALAASVVLFASGKHAEVHDDLEPCEGVFSWIEPPDPYYLTLRANLLGEHAYRKCQILAVPSFEEEWAVYLFREDDRDLELAEGRDQELPPTIVFKRLRQSLWHAMAKMIQSGSIDGSISLESEAQSAAIQRLSIEVDRFAVPVSDATADVLEKVWDGMLGRVRYTEESTGGCDGVSYFVAHHRPGSYRCGETWTPDEGTRTAALVDLAEKMGALAESTPLERRVREGALADAAHALAERLELLKEPDRDR